MTRDEIIEKVNQVFVESFETPRNKLRADVKIFEGLGLDSLDVVDLIVALQVKFGVKIRDDEQIKDIRTLGDIYKFIERIKETGEYKKT